MQQYKSPGDPYADNGNPAHDPLVFGRVLVGERVVLHPTATIGSEPFSYYTERPPYTRKPCSAGVQIGDDVEVMHHANIDRGIERDTVLGEGTKVDRHVHVAHDAIVGKHCILVAGTVIGGYAVLEDEVYCGIGVMIKPRVRIGRGAKIGMGAVVIRDVPPGLVMIGNPAEPLKLRYPIDWYEEWCGPRNALRHDPWTSMPLMKWNGERWAL